MRLSKLKLAGFKTFVDPTTVHAPGKLVGVVGPNGCGKSNIIDAVRWVLGESRASALRGESMQDVIFNGSTTRKAVSRASVELVFDNAEGKAAGQWSRYAEISVKRLLDRSGESSYFINGTQVRRKDVVDLFLGTGLGPRAYAIIEQGMISRIIEARPEEIRGFLEEAAGVTKYRERRKETEGRLRDARDNLARLDDIRGELGERIDHLRGQAEIAERYRALREAHSERQNLLWLLKRNEARREQAASGERLAELGRRLEADAMRLQALEQQVEADRAAHLAASEEVNRAQSDLYAASAEVGRLESEGQRLRDARNRIEQRLAELTREEAHWAGRLAELQAEQGRWQALLDNASVRAAQADARRDEAAQRLPEIEDQWRIAEATTQSIRRELAHCEQQLRVQEAHRASAARALDALAQRRLRLQDPAASPTMPDRAELARVEAGIEQCEAGQHALEARLAALQDELPELQQALRDCAGQERELQRGLTGLHARRDALAQLQSRLAEKGALGEWLREAGLDARPVLWQRIEVRPGCELALEAILRERLAAVMLEGRECLPAAIERPAPASVVLVLPPGPPAATGQGLAPEGTQWLRAQLHSEDPQVAALLDDWLQGVALCDELGAWAARELPPGVCVVDRRGQRLDARCLFQHAPDERLHGVLERQREIETIDAQLAENRPRLEQVRERLALLEAQLARCQEDLTACRRDLQLAQRQHHALQVDQLKLQQARQRAEEHAARVAHDLGEVDSGERREREHLQAAEAEYARAAALAALQKERLESAQGVQHEREESLRAARAAEQAISRELQELLFGERECRGKLEDNARGRALAEEQLARVARERDSRRAELECCDDSANGEALQLALALRGAREAVLAGARDALAEAGARLKANEAQRLGTEHALAPLREQVGELRLAAQAAELAIAQYDERLAEAGADEAQLQPLLGPELKEAALVREVGRLARELGELGAVNLAALDELTAASERKSWLDAQNDDLLSAIGTLEDAIRRIDRETREQLQSTYDFVNRHFGELFPQLFGGGQARLVLTGEEILDAGIQIVAQPPGKKNSSIHLLSGGEKALTAIALVFSMFQLNPAPFCMLDEVDAPLDDTNTERYGAMVRRMSAQTQFVFITHSKITMEIAEQLIGVTMQEQGVSRVVEVDIAEALRMAEAAVA